MTPATEGTLDFRLLGPMSVLRDGHEVELRGERPRAVLALLLVRRGRAVAVDAFAQEVWEREPDEISANLQVSISSLRRSLDADGTPAPKSTRGPGLIRTTAAGYTLTVPDEAVDHARFRRLASAGDEARRQGTAADAALDYAAALAEWSGERALEDLGHYGFVDVFAEALAQERTVVLQRRLEADIACGRHRDVLAELHGLVRAHPLDHVFCGQYVTALASAGRSAEAAEEYHGFRERYDTELGAAPPEDLRRIWGSVSRGQPAPSHYAGGTGTQVDERTVVDDADGLPIGELVDAEGRRTGVAGRCVLGRVSADLVVPDSKVSRSHAVVTATERGFVVSDLQSTNGTFVNGERIGAPRLLTDGDVLRVGDTEFRFTETGPVST